MFNNFKSTTVDGFYYLSKWHPFIIYNLKEERQKCFDMDIREKNNGLFYCEETWVSLCNYIMDVPFSECLCFISFSHPGILHDKYNDEKLFDNDYLILQITVLKTFIVLYC